MVLEDIPIQCVQKSLILKLISEGSEYSTVFLPNYGEFGSTIHKLIKMVYFFKAPHITVCCRKGEEAYFPTANSFFYQWNDCIDEEYKGGFYTKRRLVGVGDNIYYQKYRLCVQEDFINIQKNFPENTNYIHLWKYGIDTVFDEYSYLLSFNIKEKINYGISADIIISPRNRKSREQNNFYQWDLVVEKLNSMGLTVGCVGTRDQSLDVKGSSVNSWDYEDNGSAVIELLHNCKLYVGLDTGVSHLASFMSIPMIVFSHVNQKYYLTHWMKKCNKNFFKDLGKNIDNVDKIVEEILIYLNNVKN